MPSSFTPPILAEALRQATRLKHRQIDHHPILRALVSQSPLLADYARSLAALHGAHHELEALIQRVTAEQGWPLEYACRQTALEQDLGILGVSPYPAIRQPPSIHSLAQLVGTLYVLEGSRLGSIFLHQHLARSIPPDALNFFRQGACDADEHWRKFWSVAEKKIVSSQQTDECLAHADATFSFIQMHLNDCDDPAIT